MESYLFGLPFGFGLSFFAAFTAVGAARVIDPEGPIGCALTEVR